MPTSERPRPRPSSRRGRPAQVPSGDAGVSARERIRAAAAALAERESQRGGSGVDEQARTHRPIATSAPTARRTGYEHTAPTEAATGGPGGRTAPTSPAAPLRLPSQVMEATWSSGEWPGAVPPASAEPAAAPPERKRRRWLTVLLSSVALSIGGGGGWLALGGGGGDGGGPKGAVVEEDQGHPNAPFGRGAPPFKQSGIGLVLASPFGYEWSDDGSLSLEMWVYNAERFGAVLNCDVAVSARGVLVAQDTFPSIEGRVPPGVRRPVVLTFPASATSQKFADLSESSIDTRCRWSSR